MKKYSAENSGEKNFEKFFPLKNPLGASGENMNVLSFIFIISKHRCSLGAHFDLISFNSSYISQRRLFCFASSCLISLFSSRRLIKDS